MTKTIYNSATKIRFDRFLDNPSHAVLIAGQTGIGKKHLASALAGELLGLKDRIIISHPYVKVIESIDNKAIGIDVIRELEHFFGMKVTGGKGISRIALIYDAENLTQEAQNALLKTLEEPPADSLLILTASRPSNLLPTVRSRVQTINVQPPDREAAIKHFTTLGYDEEDVLKHYGLSAGLPGLLTSLLSEQSSHPLSEAVELARTILVSDAFIRLSLVERLSKERGLLENVLQILQQMAHLSLQTASGKQADRWQNILKKSYDTAVFLEENAQSKLLLTDLMLSL